MKRMLFLFNPNSGRRKLVQRLYDIIAIFSGAAYEVVVYPTTAYGDASAYIKERGTGFDLIVCSGGDGMISEVVNVYMHMTSPPPLGYIPSGTVNDFAESLGLPRNILQAARSIVSGRQRKIDVGVFGDKFFSYVAAFGQFTDVSYSTDQNAKNILGRAAYFLEGIKQVANVTAIGCTITIDGENIAGDFALGIITNATTVGGFRLNPGGSVAVDDGLFEAIFVHSPKNIAELSDIIGVLTGSLAGSDLIVQRTARRIELVSKEACKWTIDGEYGGQHTSVVIENRHRALGVITPHGV